nr:PREDICTED: uncharacterized protein LOC109034503 [Bemisia tabaci]
MDVIESSGFEQQVSKKPSFIHEYMDLVNSGQIEFEIQVFDDNGKIIDFDAPDYKPKYYDWDSNIIEEDKLEAYDLIDFNEEVMTYKNYDNDNEEVHFNNNMLTSIKINSKVEDDTDCDNCNRYETNNQVELEADDLIEINEEVMISYANDANGCDRIHLKTDNSRKFHSVTDDVNVLNHSSSSDCVFNKALISIVSEVNKVDEDHNNMKRATENVISGDLEEHVLEDVSVDIGMVQEEQYFGKQTVGYEEQRASFSICDDLGKIGPVSKDELELVYETSNKTGKHGREKFNRGDRDVYKRTEVSEKSGNQRVLKVDVAKVSKKEIGAKNSAKDNDISIWAKLHLKNWNFRRKLGTG